MLDDGKVQMADRSDMIEDPRTDEEPKWGPCDCHSDSYWYGLWEDLPIWWNNNYEEIKL